MWKNYIPECTFVLGVVSDKDESSFLRKDVNNFAIKYIFLKQLKI